MELENRGCNDPNSRIGCVSNGLGRRQRYNATTCKKSFVVCTQRGTTVLPVDSWVAVCLPNDAVKEEGGLSAGSSNEGSLEEMLAEAVEDLDGRVDTSGFVSRGNDCSCLEIDCCMFLFFVLVSCDQ